MKKIDEIKENLKKHKEEIRKKFRVKEIGIFGSYIREEQKEKSDIDILVEFEAPIDFFTFLELEETLSKILNLKVDLVMKKSLKPELGKHILNEVIYV